MDEQTVKHGPAMIAVVREWLVGSGPGEIRAVTSGEDGPGARWTQVGDRKSFVSKVRELGVDLRHHGSGNRRSPGPPVFTATEGAGSPIAHIRRIGSEWLLLWVPTLWFTADGDDVHTGALACLVGRSAVVTYEEGAADIHGEALDRIGAAGSPEGAPIHRIAVALLFAVVAGASRVEAALGNAVAEIEKIVFGHDEQDPAEQIYDLKREISEARRALLPVAAELPDLVDPDATNTLVIDAPMVDRLVAMVDRIDHHLDAHDGLLSDMLQVHLARVSVQQNEDMRKISAWAAILVYPTIVAGVYGMNFTHMPELHWLAGYPFALGLMAVGCVVLFRVFKRVGWL